MIAFLRSIIEESGYRVHTYTSPHLIDFRERIRLAYCSGNSTFIEEKTLSNILDECESINSNEPITFFEITTAAAFLAFSRIPADILLLEVGLGGRLDATNVIDKPLVSVITPIDIDHIRFLGKDIKKIAREKAGILKYGVPAVIAKQHPIAMEAIKTVAENIGVTTYFEEYEWLINVKNPAEFQITKKNIVTNFPSPNLPGRHQISNAGLAISCLEHLPIIIDYPSISNGIRSAQWPGRLQNITEGPLFDKLLPGSELWIDGAHNPAAAQILAQAIKEMGDEKSPSKPLILITGFMETKNIQGFLQEFREITDKLIAVPIPWAHNGVSPIKISTIAESIGISSIHSETLEQGIDIALKGLNHNEVPRILICGSLYLVGASLTASGLGII